MAIVLASSWWSWILRGILAIIFGILTFVVPGATLRVLTLLFAAYALVEGVVNCIAALRGTQGERRWWMLLLEGIVSIIAAFIAFLYPDITILVFVYLIAFWAIATGIFKIIAAIRLRKLIEGEWLLILSGVLSVLFGAIFLFLPGVGAFAIAYYVGIYALLFGILLVALGFKLRSWEKQVEQKV